jgi:TolB protein
MTTPEHLRDSLRALADDAADADLYDRAVGRSRRIAHREAVAGTVVALLMLALLSSGLWRAPARHQRPAPPPAAAGAPVAAADRAEPSAGPTGSPLPITAEPRETTRPAAGPGKRRGLPHRPPVLPVPRSRMLADLPGHVFYQERSARPDVVRLAPSDGGTGTVLAGAPSPVGISPDGAYLAYEQDGTLLVADTRGGPARQLATGVRTSGQAPAWSPDGNRLLVAAAAPAILEVGSGVLTPLPQGLGHGRQFRWSGDGSKLVFATSYCGLQVAGSGDLAGTAVPMLGDRQPADNPDGLAACHPTSVDVTGGRVTVPLQTTGATGDDGSTTADAVVDTATGAVLALPVTGTVVGMVFDARGNLLVRSVRDGVRTLSLFGPDGELLVQAGESPALRDLDLLAYTR